MSKSRLIHSIIFILLLIAVVVVLVIIKYSGFNRFVPVPRLKRPRHAQILPEKVLPKKHQIFTGKVVRILAIDGGGVRGIIPLYLLKYLEKVTGKPISSLFNVIIGTSTGSVATALLTVPNAQGKPRYTAQQVLRYYNVVAPKLLQTQWWHKLITFDGLIGPRFSAKRFDQAMEKAFGSARMSQLLSNVVISAYGIKHRQPILFKSWLAGKRNRPDYYVHDIVSGATATPTFFPPRIIYSVNHKISHVLIDGGVYLNDPALQGLLIAMKLYPNRKYIVVSLGTGIHIPKIQRDLVVKWGTIQWLKDLIIIMMESSPQITDRQLLDLSKIFPNKISYYRFNMPIGRMQFNPFNTNPKNIKQLNIDGKQLLIENKQKLRDLLEQFNKS